MDEHLEQLDTEYLRFVMRLSAQIRPSHQSHQLCLVSIRLNRVVVVDMRKEIITHLLSLLHRVSLKDLHPNISSSITRKITVRRIQLILEIRDKFLKLTNDHV